MRGRREVEEERGPCQPKPCPCRRCERCGWPMCGAECCLAPDHQPECVVGQEIGSPIDIQNFDETNHFYEVIFPMRCATHTDR